MIFAYSNCRRSSLIQRTFFVCLLLQNFFSAQAQELIPSGKGRITPLQGGYFIITAGVKTFDYSSTGSRIDLSFPYSAEDDAGAIHKTFNGSCHVPYENRHTEARTLLGIEVLFHSGPSFDCKLSTSSDAEPYGKFRSHDYFQFGMHYNLGIIPSSRRIFMFGTTSLHKNPCLVFVPGIALIRRDKDYYCGTIDSLTGKDLYVDGMKVKGADGKSTGLDKADITYATFDHLVRVEAGLWWLPAGGNFSGRSFNFSLFSFRAELGYDFLLWQTEDMYVLNPDKHFYLRRFGNGDVKRWATTSTGKPVHHYDGFSCSFTLCFRLASEY